MGSWHGKRWLMVVGTKELKGMLTARSLKVAEYEHQFKVIDAEDVRVMDMMPKNIKREFLTGGGKLTKLWKSWRSSSTKLMTDDGQVPMDPRNVGTHVARTLQMTRTRATTRRMTMCVCDRLERV